MVRKCLLSMVAVAILLVGGCEWFMPDVVDPPTEGFVSIEANLIAHYAFTSSAEDSSGWDNHGDPQGPVLAPDRSGNPNRAYQFDGNDDVIIVPNHKSLEIIGPITLAAWVYPVEQKSQCIVRKGSAVNRPLNGGFTSYDPYRLSLSGSGDVVFALSPGGSATQLRSQGYPLNTWFHIAGVFDGKEMRLYVDGVLVESEAITGELPLEQAPLLIGTRLGLPSSTFHGSIDEVRIYDRALSQAEIELLAE